MSEPVLLDHRHQPVYRVVRAGWADPLDASFSRQAPDRRWNTPSFAALYCCCTEKVARAVALDVLRYAGLVLGDLRPAARPELAEIDWSGPVIDVATAEGLAAAGLPSDYPLRVDRATTRDLGTVWYDEGRQGVICRSASLARLGVTDWSGSHERWSELAIFPANAENTPTLRRRRTDPLWLKGVTE